MVEQAVRSASEQIKLEYDAILHQQLCGMVVAANRGEYTFADSIAVAPIQTSSIRSPSSTKTTSPGKSSGASSRICRDALDYPVAFYHIEYVKRA